MNNLYCFSDESYVNQEYKCLGFVYLDNAENLKKLRTEIFSICKSFSGSEFKWNKVSSKKDVNHTKHLIDLVFDFKELNVLSVCMRKLLILLNNIMKRQTPWEISRPQNAFIS